MSIAEKLLVRASLFSEQNVTTRKYGGLMIGIEKLKTSDIEFVKKIHIPDEQVQFACTAEEFLLDDSETTHLHIIKLNGKIIGFFKLDTAYPKYYSFCLEGGIGLRSFAIDKEMQGKGFGTRIVKALFPYLKTHYANVPVIYLTVNCKNYGAKTCYQKGGFECLSEKYLGGDAGPQYIMRRKLA